MYVTCTYLSTSWILSSDQRGCRILHDTTFLVMESHNEYVKNGVTHHEGVKTSLKSSNWGTSGTFPLIFVGFGTFSFRGFHRVFQICQILIVFSILEISTNDIWRKDIAYRRETSTVVPFICISRCAEEIEWQSCNMVLDVFNEVTIEFHNYRFEVLPIFRTKSVECSHNLFSCCDLGQKCNMNFIGFFFTNHFLYF